MRRKAFAAQVWSRLIAFERAHALLPQNARVLAAVSGGPDSVCMAHFLCAMARRRGLTVALAYVDHGLRRAAASEARFVQKLGRALGTEVFILKADVAAVKRARRGGTEDAARVARYAALTRLAVSRRYGVVAVGQHLDDQAETFMLHLLRSERAAALGAMPPKRALASRVTLIRPLLPLTRAQIMAYLKIHDLSFRVDRSNQSPKFLRNWVRASLLPLLARKQPRIREHLASLSAEVRALTAADGD